MTVDSDHQPVIVWIEGEEAGEEERGLSIGV